MRDRGIGVKTLREGITGLGEAEKEVPISNTVKVRCSGEGSERLADNRGRRSGLSPK